MWLRRNAGKRVRVTRDWFNWIVLIGWQSGASILSQLLSIIIKTKEMRFSFEIQVKAAL